VALLVAVAAVALRQSLEIRGPGQELKAGSRADPAIEERVNKEDEMSQVGKELTTGLVAVAAAVMMTTTVQTVEAGGLPEGWDKQSAVFRGPDGSGNLGAAKVPTEWKEKGGKNIKWKTPIPIKGWASAVVWGDKVVTTGADKEKREIYGFDAATGKIVWTCTVSKSDNATDDYAPSTQDARWDEIVFAGSTPATDGKKAVALFSNCQLVAVDLATGKEEWKTVIGTPGGNSYGQCSSLLIHGGNVIVSFEGESQFVAAYGLADGKEVWKAKRKGGTWASPMLAKSGDKYVVIVASDPQVMVLDAEKGTTIWSKDLITDGVEYAYGPSPLVVGDVLVVAGEKCGIIGVNLATGAKVWSYGKTDNVDKFSDGTSLTTDGKHVFHFFQSFLTCLDAKTGKQVKEKDMGDTAGYGSPMVADGKLYLPTSGGGTLICSADPAGDFAPVGKGELEATGDGSPAVAGGCIYLRADDAMYCIGAK
jgi:outer membrane protein assembly factor BamB